MSREFTDTESRVWRIALDPWLVTKVKNETDVLLTALQDNSWALSVRLRTDIPLLFDILWAICDEQAASNGCKAEADKRSAQLTREFARGLGGNTLLAAVDALEGGISDFCRNQDEAQAMGVVLEKAKQVGTILGKKLLEEVTAIDPEQVAKNYIATASSSRPSSESTLSPEE